MAKIRILKKELSLLSVYAIATGTTLSAGFFLLPGIAAADAGPAVILSYAIAGLLVVPAMFSIVELATAMPRAGGAYYFLDRSLGPLAGTVGGFGTWLALVLKAAFALYGMGAYIALVAPETSLTATRLIAAGLAVLFGVVNLLGAGKAGRAQLLLVSGLLVILAWFIGRGGMSIDRVNFDGFFDSGSGIVATAGMVFISYVGVTNIASVSEEVKDPERNLPRGIFLALGTAIVIYIAGIGVMIGVVGATQLATTDTPVEMAAAAFGGKPAVIVVSVAAVLAFSSVANAGIMSASRYPLAMSRDHLVPGVFSRLSRGGTPRLSIIVTVLAIIGLLFAGDAKDIAKLASAFQLVMFGLLCLAVIVMRQSGLESYDPGFKSPLYPWMQILGMVGPIFVIAAMGTPSVLFSGGLIVVGITWYQLYARPRVERHGAIYHVFERLGQRRYHGLDTELRTILKEKGLRDEDPFEQIVAHASVVAGRPGATYETIVEEASKQLAERVPATASELARRFMEGTRIGATPVAGGVALPHLRLMGVNVAKLVLVRIPEGIEVPLGEMGREVEERHPRTHAIFFLISPDGDPGRHLRLLAQIAGRVEQEGFLEEWRVASDEQALKESLLRDDRFITIPVRDDARSAELIGHPLRELSIPEGCLVAIIRRGGQALVPDGNTRIESGDWLTVIGSASGIVELRQRYGLSI